MTEEQPSMYQNGKIYKIVDNGYNLCSSMSSTVQPLSKRLSVHKKITRDTWLEESNDPQQFIKYSMNLVLTVVKLSWLNYFHVISRLELHKREGEIIKNNECVE
jgi:hypothetical protein